MIGDKLVNEYLGQAAELLRIAEQTANEADKVEMIRIATQWEVMAQFRAQRLIFGRNSDQC